jgi:hypothetical protein
LVEWVRVIEVVGIVVCPERFVEKRNDLIERGGAPGSDIIHTAAIGLCGQQSRLHNVFDIHKVALLLPVFKDPRSLARLNLLRQLVDHAGSGAFVGLAWPVHIEVPEPDDSPVP